MDEKKEVAKKKDLTPEMVAGCDEDQLDAYLEKGFREVYGTKATNIIWKMNSPEP